MPKSIAITDKELEVLMALERHGTLKAVAEVLRLKESTVRSRILRLRMRAEDAKRFLREYERWAGKLLKYL